MVYIHDHTHNVNHHIFLHFEVYYLSYIVFLYVNMENYFGIHSHNARNEEKEYHYIVALCEKYIYVTYSPLTIFSKFKFSVDMKT